MATSEDNFLKSDLVMRAESDDVTSGIFDRMREAGVTLTAQPRNYSDIFATWRSQRGMIADHARTSSFERAIVAETKPGAVVVDLGSGSGILSLFAARAGASKVYGLEITDIASDAAEIAADNGYASIVTFVQGDAAHFSCDEPIDLIVSEWAGLYLIDEWRHFATFCAIRDRLLRTGGRVIPQKASLFLAPIDNSQLYYERGFGFWKNLIYGFDFSVAGRRQISAPRRIIVEAQACSIIDQYEVASISCGTDHVDALLFEREFSRKFRVASVCHGFLGYFNLTLCPGVILDTSPFSKQTHWKQSYFPIEELFIAPEETLIFSVKTYLNDAFDQINLQLTAGVRRSDGSTINKTYVYPIDNSYS